MSEPKKFMDREQILSAIENLGKCQGFYSRLYANLQNLRSEDPEQYEACMNALEKQQFSDSVDLVLYFES